ncbi:MAG: DUF1573 domain-containing protein [Bacteroidota bacterium]|nr:DUF1573 domain-containing protein [Bacteroidota bacterium]
MKKILLSLALVAGVTAVNAQIKETHEHKHKKSDVTQTETVIVDATIDFESRVVDYGVIEYNADGVREFVFTNNGTEPLIIKNAKGSCGCTVPTWSREPIAPGATSEIGVKYATNRVGKFTKTITLTTNADKKPVILTIKGEVNPAPKDPQDLEKKTEGAPLEKK